MTEFVLVHGAWHGAWCWYKVTAELERRGHSVQALDLPGHGVDKTPTEAVTLEAYAARVAAVLENCEAPAVLVGHSMGGIVISETAELVPERVGHLVYLCAFMEPPGGDTAAEARAGMAGSGVPEAMINHDNGTTTIKPERLRPVFYADCSEADIQLAKACLVPQKNGAIRGQRTHTQERWGSVPRSYLVCKDDMAITEAAQRGMIERTGCDQVIELATSHSPFFSAPDALVDALEACQPRQ